MALVVLADQQLSPAEDDAPPLPGSALGSKAAVPASPPETRLVGRNKVVVAVPQNWSTDGVGCDGHTAIESTVVFDASGTRACKVLQSTTPPSLHIVSTDSVWSRPWVEAQGTETTVDGVMVKRVDGGCDQLLPGRCSGAVVVESQDAVMYVLSDEPDVVSAVLDSVQILPAGYTTIPVDHSSPVAATIATMQDVAGLKVDIVHEAVPGLSQGVLLDTDPALGEVVQVGGSVTVTISVR